MVNEKCLEKYGKKLENCENHEIYTALLELVSEKTQDKVSNEGKKKIYYINIYKKMVANSDHFFKFHLNKQLKTLHSTCLIRVVNFSWAK